MPKIEPGFKNRQNRVKIGKKMAPTATLLFQEEHTGETATVNPAAPSRPSASTQVSAGLTAHYNLPTLNGWRQTQA